MKHTVFFALVAIVISFCSCSTNEDIVVNQKSPLSMDKQPKEIVDIYARIDSINSIYTAKTVATRSSIPGLAGRAGADFLGGVAGRYLGAHVGAAIGGVT